MSQTSINPNTGPSVSSAGRPTIMKIQRSRRGCLPDMLGLTSLRPRCPVRRIHEHPIPGRRKWTRYRASPSPMLPISPTSPTNPSYVTDNIPRRTGWVPVSFLGWNRGPIEKGYSALKLWIRKPRIWKHSYSYATNKSRSSKRIGSDSAVPTSSWTAVTPFWRAIGNCYALKFKLWSRKISDYKAIKKKWNVKKTL